MDFFTVPVPWFIALPAALIAAGLLIDAGRRIDLAGITGMAWLAPVVALFVAAAGWSLGPQLGAEFKVRFLSTALFTLLFGYTRALVMLALVVLAHAAWHAPGIAAFGAGLGMNLLMHVILPVWLMAWLCAQVKQHLPRNPLCFMLGCGLFAAFLTLAAQWTASTLLAIAFTPQSTAAFVQVLPFALLFSWGEAFLGGMVVTILAVYHPGAVASYDEAHYLPVSPGAEP